ncbi:MAG: hypothetical protein K9H64_13020 [Bacteroidales bacterium]|nr:hypothetical protein [Bacteroidales bacterium]MCF8456570.1 hypothetical protein [Bacteroidales bacterium]
MLDKFEALGSLIKEEELKCLKEKILTNTCVLESDVPFPGYHHDVPIESIPRHVFLMTSKAYNREQVTRATHNIKKYCPFEFDAVSGEVFINNNTLPCVRIKGLENYEDISELQTYYQNEGFKFMKQEKIRAKGIIKVKKTFVLEEVKPGIYCDKLDDKMGYFQISKNISWKLFEKITYAVRNNWTGQHFDAAQAFFYRNFDIVEVVRIFHRSQDISSLEELQALYNIELAKY